MPDAESSNPLPGVELGDPFVLPGRGRSYPFGTNDGPGCPTAGLQLDADGEFA
ncbi:MAG TPA: hypothetical protein VG406_00970 [Isosphaeraceae bacterium]|jgi:hypothetical protein|nr:hypothetical protein [Isosphaeraceae bacterium]